MLSTAAPINPVIAPGKASFKIIDLSTFSNFKCDSPDAAVVATSEKCIVAEAIAGAIPNVNSNEDEVAPNPIPRDPSINCAKNPTIANIVNFRICYSFL